VIDVTPRGMELVERAPGVSVEEIQEKTEPVLIVSPKLKEMTV